MIKTMVDINTIRNNFGAGVISLEKGVVKGNKQPVMFDDLKMATSSLNGQFTRHILHYKHILLIENHILNPMSYSWTVSSKFIHSGKWVCFQINLQISISLSQIRKVNDLKKLNEKFFMSADIKRSQSTTFWNIQCSSEPYGWVIKTSWLFDVMSRFKNLELLFLMPWWVWSILQLKYILENYQTEQTGDATAFFFLCWNIQIQKAHKN